MKLPIFGVPVNHSNGQFPRVTRPGLRDLLARRPDLEVRITSKFDGSVDGMMAVDDGIDARDSLISFTREGSAGFGCYSTADKYGTDAMTVFGYAVNYRVTAPETARRRKDVEALPRFGAIADEARMNWFRGAALDPMGWDEAMEELRGVTTEDHLLLWLKNRKAHPQITMRLQRIVEVVG
jgi:hypothetical protein